MRCKISLHKISSNPLSYDYQYGLASMLYKRLATANIDLADQLHNDKGFKFYTFSNLIIEDIQKQNNKGLNFTKAHFILSSPDIEFIKSFSEGLLMEPEFFLGRENKVNFIIENIDLLPQRMFNDKCCFKTISPIYVKTMRRKDNKLVEYDLYPKDAKFYENLHLNLIARYEEYYGYKIEQDFFDILEINNFKPKRISIGNSFRRCSHLNLKIEANPKLIEFAYDAGLGEKNAMGFGCLDII